MTNENKTKEKIKEIIKNSKQSAEYFIEKFCKVKHQGAGTIPFQLFKYQRKCLDAFKKKRFNIFSKCRQCGISTLTGAYALWMIMLFKNKTILVISKTDRDATEFLQKNIKFVYENLPAWMRKLWKPVLYNEHTIAFSNGSKITSLPSSPNVMRQYSASLVIIDEAAFTPHIDDMWTGGYPTLLHGGHCIVISTSGGVGNWYWKYLHDAKEGKNDFNAIEIEWWDMDWKIQYTDINSNLVSIEPTYQMRLSTGEEIITYGKYWSPWLEEQYRALTERGDSSKFRQEILRDFLGTGNTVIPKSTIEHIKLTLEDPIKTPEYLNFQDRKGNKYNIKLNKSMWIWNEPEKNHTYTIGVDISSGEANDYSVIQILDTTTKEQVLEAEIKLIPRELSKLVEYLGYYYNLAIIVPERTGMGVTVCQDLQESGYPKLYHSNLIPNAKNKKLKTKGTIGFLTGPTTKPILNEALINCLDQEGYYIKSQRVYKQAQTYVYLSPIKTGAEKGSGNDDIIIGLGLALMGSFQTIRNEPMAFFKGTTEVDYQIQDLPPEMAIPFITQRDDINDQENAINTMIGQLLPISR